MLLFVFSLTWVKVGAVANDVLEKQAEAVRRRAGLDFTVIVESPFVVAGDEPRETVRTRARQIVRWAVTLLKRDFFARDPEEAITIWLFRDRVSYERHLQDLFGEEPVSPYGYYSRRHSALFMNIATGGGTLVHEIVHPFMRANFPACPPWFNEGLASLFEQCDEEEGRIVGRVNWRLPGLQERIEQGALPPFQELMSMDAATFYGEGGGYSVNYAQARYLCYYLQERGVLRQYYAAFVAASKDDPTGLETLRSVLGIEDMDAFQREWQSWILRRRFVAG